MSDSSLELSNHELDNSREINQIKLTRELGHSLWRGDCIRNALIVDAGDGEGRVEIQT